MALVCHCTLPPSACKSCPRYRDEFAVDTITTWPVTDVSSVWDDNAPRVGKLTVSSDPSDSVWIAPAGTPLTQAAST
jgi:hypothetical protein